MLPISFEAIKDLLKKPTYTNLVINEDLDKSQFDELVEILKKNTSVTSLSFLKPIGDAGARKVAEIFTENKTITNLSLIKTRIYNGGAEYIFSVLRNNNTLKTLNLTHNKIDNKGVSYIVDFIKDNKSLTELNLDQNKISEEGIRRIVKALEVNNILKKIGLNSNLTTNSVRTDKGQRFEFAKLMQQTIQCNKKENEEAKNVSIKVKSNWDVVYFKTAFSIGFVGAPLPFIGAHKAYKLLQRAKWKESKKNHRPFFANNENEPEVQNGKDEMEIKLIKK